MLFERIVSVIRLPPHSVSRIIQDRPHVLAVLHYVLHTVNYMIPYPIELFPLVTKIVLRHYQVNIDILDHVIEVFEFLVYIARKGFQFLRRGHVPYHIP